MIYRRLLELTFLWEKLELCQVRSDIRERFFPQRVLGTAQASQGMGMAPRLPELQEHLDNAPRHRLGLLVMP